MIFQLVYLARRVVWLLAPHGFRSSERSIPDVCRKCGRGEAGWHRW